MKFHYHINPQQDISWKKRWSHLFQNLWINRHSMKKYSIPNMYTDLHTLCCGACNCQTSDPRDTVLALQEAGSVHLTVFKDISMQKIDSWRNQCSTKTRCASFFNSQSQKIMRYINNYKKILLSQQYRSKHHTRISNHIITCIKIINKHHFCVNCYYCLIYIATSSPLWKVLDEQTG